MDLMADGTPFTFDNVTGEALQPTAPGDAAQLLGSSFEKTTEADIKDAIASLEAKSLVERVTAGDPRRMDWLVALAGLEEKIAKGETLTPFEAEYRSALMSALADGQSTSQVYVQEMLLKKVGPEKYKRIARRYVDHQKELEILGKINTQLNLEIEAREKLRGPPIPGPKVLSEKVDPGIWLIQVDLLGKIANSFKITPKADGTMPDLSGLVGGGTTNAALAKTPPWQMQAQDDLDHRTGFYAAVLRFLVRVSGWLS